MSPDLALLLSALSFAIAGAVLALSTYVTLWTGLLSFATVTFAAIGAFSSSWFLNNDYGGVVAVLAGTGLAGLAGLVVGRLFIKLDSHWLALATVALMLITRVVVVNLPEDIAGGNVGVVVPPALERWHLVAILVVVCVLLALLARSRFGVAAATAREDPAVAASLGVPVRRVHIAAFGLSGLLGGLGGVMLASQLNFIDPDSFFLDLAVAVLASVVLGGAYHWSGSVIGAAVFTGLPVYISQYITHGEAIINGVLLLIIIIWLPGGLVDPLRWRRFRGNRLADAASERQEAATRPHEEGAR